MNKEIKALIKNLKSIVDLTLLVHDPQKKEIAGRILKNFADLSQELRVAIVPTLEAISGFIFNNQ